GVVASAGSFVAVAEERGKAGSLFPGHYRMRRGMSAASALDLLTEPRSRMVRRVVVPEGLRLPELLDRLARADGPREMLTLLEEELTRRLCETAGLGLVRHTSSVIAATGGAVSIGDLSVAAGVSSTHLAQRFKELIGVTPKRLARTHRFAATVFAIDPAGPIDWGDLAGGAGYFDQAHFGHEFRAFTGLTPTRYVEIRRRFLREHPGHVLDGWPLPAD
ncbi:helix-turn-helix domain-containing protein, partial [Streptosporangium algeriense]